MEKLAIVFGAGSEIGVQLVQQLLLGEQVDKVITVSRGADIPVNIGLDAKLLHFQTDYSEAALASIVTDVQDLDGHVSHVIICNGVLHNASIRPEKRLEDIAAAQLLEVLRINAVVPMLCLARLAPLLKSRQPCCVAVFSARVGSIGDNHKGGWYAYRASKAALNMLMKTAAIELQRRAPNVRALLFHPGTTDTGLSRPFQRSVPTDKLFTPAFVARRLLGLMQAAPAESDIQFLDWDGKPVPW